MSDGGAFPWEMLWNALKATYQVPYAKAFGARVAIIGPKATGKSHIFHFIEKGELLEEAPHATTVVAQINGWMPKFIGRDKNYLQVASYVDTTGQSEHTAGADAIGILMPSIVIISLDGTEDFSSNNLYVSSIMESLCESDERVRSNIKLVAIFLNKYDKVIDKDSFFNDVSKLQATAKEKGGQIFVNKCISCHTVFVETDEFGTRLAEQAFTNMRDKLRS